MNWDALTGELIWQIRAHTAGITGLAISPDGDIIATSSFDEVRFVFSLWHPSANRAIDLDQAYVELSCSLDEEEDHWVKLAEIEPVVPPYNTSGTFDGWIVLPILGASTAFELSGVGFAPRARIQIRASAYLVA